MTYIDAADSTPSLKHFPIAFFAVVMGMWGWTLAAQAAVGQGVLSEVFADRLRWGAVLVTGLVFAAYGAKLVLHASSVLEEWRTPPKMVFFPAISISLLLIGTAYLADAPEFGETIWLVGVAAQGILTLLVITSWLGQRDFQIGQLSPAWFIPAVGNVVVPLGGAQLGYMELSWLFFTAGLIFWLILLTLVAQRLLFHGPLPAKLVPTLAILIAPPAVAFASYVGLTGGIDAFARILLNAAYVFALLVLGQVAQFRALPFALSWWALSFPVAALVVASFTFGAMVQLSFYTNIAAMILGALSLVIVFLLAKTVLALLKGKFFRPEV